MNDERCKTVSEARHSASLARLVACLYCTLLVGCQVPIKREDVVATWVITSESTKILGSKLAPTRATISLNGDGSFAARGMSGDALFIRPEERQQIFDGNGKWWLGTHQGSTIVVLRFEEINDARRSAELLLSIYRTKSVFELVYYYGDPDQGKRIAFAKER
jgi:hypothetical protein